LEVDPLSPEANHAMLMVCYSLKRYDEAIGYANRMRDVGADPRLVANRLGWCYLGKNDFGKAIEAFRNDPDSPSHLAVAYAMSGNTDEARKILNNYNEKSKTQFVNAWSRVAILLALGENDEAIGLLQKAYNEWGHDDAFGLFNIVHLFEGIRTDPRFVELLQKTGLGETT